MNIESVKNRIPTCPHSNREDIAPRLIELLALLEQKLDETLDYVSGVRCRACNAAVGGVPGSAHIKGLAVDIGCGFSGLRYKIIKNAIKIGFTRIGVAKTFIHLDIDDKKPRDVLWVY